MQEEIMDINAEQLVGETARIKVGGYRFVTLSCVETGENQVELLYHFDKNLKLLHYRVIAAKDRPVPSISPVYFAAFLVENEIQDLFGIRFEGLVLDYEGTFYLDEEVKKTPFCRYFVSGNSGGTEAVQAVPDGSEAAERS